MNNTFDINNLNQMTDEIDSISRKLMKEFKEHFQEFLISHPEAKDDREIIFQAWIIQKVASLQYMIQHLVESQNEHLIYHKNSD
jgi:hypothetical protein